MGTHVKLWLLLVQAIAGMKVTPFDPGGGSPNYKLMFAFTAWIVDPSPANLRRCLELLANMKRTGHLSLRGPGGVATETGSPGAHWKFNITPVLGGLKWATSSSKRHQSPELVEACLSFLEDEIGLDLHFRYGGVVAMCCPRLVAGEDDSRDEEQVPVDGYRNVTVALALGEPVKKPPKYWAKTDATGVATMRELMVRHPEWKKRFASAQVPHLYLPIEREPTRSGGYVAWIEDTAAARAAMGRDACHWVSNGPEGVLYRIDFQPKTLHAGQEAA